MNPAQMSGDRHKQIALDGMEVNQRQFLDITRKEASKICRRQGFVTSDQVRAWAERNGIEPEHCNHWGGVLRGPMFKAYGQPVASQIPSNHGREIKRWVLA